MIGIQLPMKAAALVVEHKLAYPSRQEHLGCVAFHVPLQRSLLPTKTHNGNPPLPTRSNDKAAPPGNQQPAAATTTQVGHARKTPDQSIGSGWRLLGGFLVFVFLAFWGMVAGLWLPGRIPKHK